MDELKKLQDLFAKDGVLLPLSWVQQCAEYMSTRGPFDASSSSAFAQMESVLLCADLHLARDPSQPSLLHQCEASTDTNACTSIVGPVMVQVDEVVNVGTSRRERMKGNVGANRYVKMYLTDGVRDMVAYELEPIEGLSPRTEPGCKLVIRNVQIRHGVLLLRPNNVQVRGGVVERLRNCTLKAEEEPIPMLTSTGGTAGLRQAEAIAHQMDHRRTPPRVQQQAQQQAEALAEAYAHTSTAQTAMSDAIELLTQVQQEEGGVSHDPQPALEFQQEAMESLMAAIQALQPPQQNPDQGEDEQDQQEQMSKQQAERRLEAAKEREAERAKKRQEASGTVPVEKDW